MRSWNVKGSDQKYVCQNRALRVRCTQEVVSQCELYTEMCREGTGVAQPRELNAYTHYVPLTAVFVKHEAAALSVLYLLYI